MLLVAVRDAVIIHVGSSEAMKDQWMNVRLYVMVDMLQVHKFISGHQCFELFV
jgi:hypothetical protein